MFHLSEEKQILLTQKIMSSLDEWGLSAAQQIIVLALPDDIRTRKLRSFHENTPLPHTDDVEFRALRILGIIDALRTSHPKNHAMASRWMATPHKRFQNRPPVQVMLEEGSVGVNSVLAELDCTYAWDLSGSSAK